MNRNTVEAMFLRWCKQRGFTSEQYINDQREAFYAGYNCKKGLDNRAAADEEPTRGA